MEKWLYSSVCLGPLVEQNSIVNEKGKRWRFPHVYGPWGTFPRSFREREFEVTAPCHHYSSVTELPSGQGQERKREKRSQPV